MRRARGPRTLGGLSLLAAMALFLSGGLTAFGYFSSSGSGALSAIIGDLSAPTNVSAVATGSSVTVTWDAVTAPGGGRRLHGDAFGHEQRERLRLPDTDHVHDLHRQRRPERHVHLHRRCRLAILAIERRQQRRHRHADQARVHDASAGDHRRCHDRHDHGRARGRGRQPHDRRNDDREPDELVRSGAFRNLADSVTITSVSIPDGSSSASFKYTDTAAGTPTHHRRRRFRRPRLGDPAGDRELGERHRARLPHLAADLDRGDLERDDHRSAPGPVRQPGHERVDHDRPLQLVCPGAFLRHDGLRPS